ncbi:kelch-like protein 10 [Bombina bombina]|uniref:kelch-like protein 10 n=1 Tax=Bombina bombina TaxID=8345 RepID=UPI00235A7EAB|nr:kelch-like protein 10 [Bombina bombina]
MEGKMSIMACSIFNELRMEEKLCDVIIRVNGVDFNAHKNILCTCSNYFRVLFTSGWAERKHNVYTITGISPDMMKLIIDYAYTRTVPVTAENVEELLAAADQFNVMGIVRACCTFMESHMCLKNCIGLYKFTDYYYCPELQQKAQTYILQNFTDIVKASDEFLELSLMEFSNIIEQDELNVKKEDAVFDAIVKWIGHDQESRKNCISFLLTKVRFGLMHADFFMNNVKSNDYVKNCEECKPIIINALQSLFNLNMHGQSTLNFSTHFSRPRLPFAILFAIGGWSGSSPTNIIEAYDIRANCWVNVTGKDESPRAYHGAVYLNGFVYVIGGFDSLDYFNSMKRFDPVEKTWHQLSPMHSRRCYVSVTILDKLIYAMGGFDGYVRLSSAERYEPEDNQWTLIAPMHEQRSDASATTFNGKVYICGGFNGKEYLFTAEVYNPMNNQWSLIANMKSRRSGVGVTAYGNHVYAVGGFDGANRLRTAEAYCPISDTWRNITNMFNQRSNFGIEVVDDLLFVVGGFNGFTTVFNVEYYDEKKSEWYNAHDMSVYRSALSCCVVSGLSNIREYTAQKEQINTYL